MATDLSRTAHSDQARSRQATSGAGGLFAGSDAIFSLVSLLAVAIVMQSIWALVIRPR
jgi:hypothetical protein